MNWQHRANFRCWVKNILATVVVTLCLSMLWVSAQAASGPVTLNVDVAPGKWKGVRLRNLPKDAVVAVKVQSSGEILVALVDSGDYLRYSHSDRSLFIGRIEKRLSFSVSIRAAGDHYLMFDNRSGKDPKSVRATIHAARSREDQIETADKILSEFERQLHQIFVFDPFPIRVEQCGEPKAFVDTSGIVLCTEYVQHLYDALGNRQMAQNALAFSIFHEVGRILLSKWNHPSSAKQDTADEFATVLMVMVKQNEQAVALSEYFIKNPSAPKAIMKLLRDDRHPLSVQRARKVLGWLKDSQLVLKWQKILVPHMQTPLLKKLRQHPTSWTDLPLVARELATRQKTIHTDI